MDITNAKIKVGLDKIRDEYRTLSGHGGDAFTLSKETKSFINEIIARVMEENTKSKEEKLKTYLCTYFLFFKTLVVLLRQNH